ncbi:MAG: PhoU domain-containing protein, partial [Candidatus Omnitrophica bacterium]|nr:PhoU domain-containing protein [Candidatus Omnitrophota bacterium]
MFDNLLAFWRGKDFLKGVLQEFEKMLTDTEDMFRRVCSQMLESKADGELKEEIYRIDKEVNRLEKDIRTRIVAHLSIQGNVDLPASLVLMSVVKDAERLGDYAKN